MALFNQIRGLKPHRSLFNLSYDNKFNCDMGQLIPVCCLETLPGDTFKIGNECIVRLQPTLAPILQQLDFRVEYFFVPNRLLWEHWEEYITTGKEGLQIGDDGKYEIEYPLPLWDDYWRSGSTPAKYSLWDYFGLPLVSTSASKDPKKDMVPISFPRTAYNLIFNTYYKDENVDNDVSLTNNSVLNRRWKKDYFTSALPFQQRGQAPGFSFELGGAHTVFKGNVAIANACTVSDILQPGTHTGGAVGRFPSTEKTDGGNYHIIPGRSGANTLVGGKIFGYGTSTIIGDVEGLGTYDNYLCIAPKVGTDIFHCERDADRDYVTDTTARTTYGLDDNEVEFSGSPAGFNIAELRESFQIQKWMERNARGGYRYVEQCLSHFGVSAKDSRLQRPEYLGMVKSSIVVSEIAQTSETTATSALGKLGGRGLGASAGRLDKFFSPEHGYIIGIFSIVPKQSYCSQGISKCWLRRSVFDYYFPEFSHLSEQQVRKGELFFTGTASNDTAMFGYQGIYDEYRHNRGIVTADMRDTFDYWHLARKFTNQPSLNSSFLQINGGDSSNKRIFAVADEPGFIVDFYNNISAIRPMPKIAEPGFIDHF